MTVPFNEPYDSLGQPHDHLFRAIVGDRKRAQDLLHTHVGPRFPGLLAPVPPIPRAGNFVDENLRSSQVDQLFEVQLCNGDTAFVYVLLEHKSTSDPGIALQLARYKNRIWDAYVAGDLPVDGQVYPDTRVGRLRALPAIIPVVFYHGRDPWTAPYSIWEMIPDLRLRELESKFGYVLRDLGALSLEELAKDPALRAGLTALRYSHRGTAAQRQEVLPGVLADLPDETMYTKQVIVYLMYGWCRSRRWRGKRRESSREEGRGSWDKSYRN